MNIREYQRGSTPTLPNSNETNQRTVIRLLNEAILMMAKRDEDKEKRIRILEEEVKRNKGARSPEIHMGEEWILVASRGMFPTLEAHHSNDGFVTQTDYTLAP